MSRASHQDNQSFARHIDPQELRDALASFVNDPAIATLGLSHESVGHLLDVSMSEVPLAQSRNQQ